MKQSDKNVKDIAIGLLRQLKMAIDAPKPMFKSSYTGLIFSFVAIYFMATVF